MNETVNVVTTKTSEIGQKTWGLMRGVMALASQKVEEFTKEGPGSGSGFGSGSNNDSWQRKESEGNGYYQEFGNESKGWNSSAGAQPSTDRQFNSVSSGSWDDWDTNESKKEQPSKGTKSLNSDNWAGWDDGKDDGFDNFYQSAPDHNNKTRDFNGNSDAKWSGGGFL